VELIRLHKQKHDKAWMEIDRLHVLQLAHGFFKLIQMLAQLLDLAFTCVIFRNVQ
jgi:hypothetical protein